MKYAIQLTSYAVILLTSCVNSYADQELFCSGYDAGCAHGVHKAHFHAGAPFQLIWIDPPPCPVKEIDKDYKNSYNTGWELGKSLCFNEAYPSVNEAMKSFGWDTYR